MRESRFLCQQDDSSEFITLYSKGEQGEDPAPSDTLPIRACAVSQQTRLLLFVSAPLCSNKVEGVAGVAKVMKLNS